MLWDVFCRVIDNHGDVGVCWRLSAELAARGQAVRLWLDDDSALAWMAPAGHPGVQVVRWSDPAPHLEPGDVVIEAFGCDPPDSFVAELALRRPKWINLEYLSAQPYVERSHGLPSPVLHGPAAGLVKTFFYPGFTDRTGGLLRERDLAQRQAVFDSKAWLAAQGVTPRGQLLSLFCYEPPALPQLIEQLAAARGPSTLLVAAGRPRACMQRLLQGATQRANLAVHYLPLLSQRDFDHLLWSCDLNFVRGEDSLVRAIWAGKPFVWQAYPQSDAAHHAKVDAFLHWLQAPAGLRRVYEAWNGMANQPLPPLQPAAWRTAAELARERALALPDLAAGLLHLATARGTI